MKSPDFPCGYCKGTGRKTLSRNLLPTLAAIKKLGNPTCAEIRSNINQKMHQSTVFKQVRLLIQKKLVRKLNSRGDARYQVTKLKPR